MFAIFLGVAALLLFLGYVNVTTTAGGDFYQEVVYGEVKAAVPVTLDPSGFKVAVGDFVDSDGMLKPGTLIQADGNPITAPAQTATYMTYWPIKIGQSNTDADLDAAPNQVVGLFAEGKIVRAAVEHNYGRVMSADELAAIGLNTRFLLLA